jgi:long-chain acyl-CoA synthetase
LKDKSMLYPAVEYSTLKELMEETVRQYSENNAFILKRTIDGKMSYENITYSAFGEDMTAFGTALIKRGYAGKRIAIIGKNSYPWLVGYFAGLNGGNIVVPLDKGLPLEELESCLIRSKSDIILFDKEHIDLVNSIIQKGDTMISLIVAMQPEGEYLSFEELIRQGKELVAQGDTSFADVQIDPYTMSLILFTSGTTSASKAVMLSHKNLASNNYALQCCELVYSTDVNMAFLPLHHTFSSTGVTFMISKGATNVFCDG